MDRRSFLAKVGLGAGAAAVGLSVKPARALSPMPPKLKAALETERRNRGACDVDLLD
jgi:hypothetical protein